MSIDFTRWIVPGIFAIVALAVLVFAAVIFLAAYFEKRHLVPLAPAGPDAPQEREGKAGDFITAAEHLGFQHIGYFRETSGLVKARETMLLSADQQTLAMVVHGRLARIQFYSKLRDGRWLITYQEGSEPDLSGLRIQIHRP